MIDLLELAKKERIINFIIQEAYFPLDEILEHDMLDYFIDDIHSGDKVTKPLIQSLRNGNVIHFTSEAENIKNIVFCQNYENKFLVCFIDSDQKGDYNPNKTDSMSYLEYVLYKLIGTNGYEVAKFSVPYNNYKPIIYEKGLGYFFDKNRESFLNELNDLDKFDYINKTLFIPNYISENNQKIFNINWIKAEKGLIYFLLNRPSCVNYVSKYLNIPLYHGIVFQDLNFEYFKKHDFSTKEIIKNIESEQIELYLNRLQIEFSFINIFSDNLLKFFINTILYLNEKEISINNSGIESIQCFIRKKQFLKYKTLLETEDNIRYELK